MLRDIELNLASFGEYLLRKRLVPEHRAKYWVLWVRRFLQRPVQAAL